VRQRNLAFGCLRLEARRRQRHGAGHDREVMTGASPAILAGLVLAGVLGALAVPEVLSQPLIAGEARIIDGDSLEILPRQYGEKPTRVRLSGVDAPELRQMCGVIHCGLAAKGALTDAIRGALVTCKPSGLDRYGRTLAQCATRDIKDLGAHLVGTGYARAAYGDRYRDAEDAARAERLGLWRTSAGDFSRRSNFGDPEEWWRGK
jgi:endonuclease YncB( thermonuclease family)